jgi:hypothetical protein
VSINDIIATSSINAFNEGVATGQRLERERLIQIAKDLAQPYETGFANECGEILFINDLISYLKMEGQ